MNLSVFRSPLRVDLLANSPPIGFSMSAGHHVHSPSASVSIGSALTAPTAGSESPAMASHRLSGGIGDPSPADAVLGDVQLRQLLQQPVAQSSGAPGTLTGARDRTGGTTQEEQAKESTSSSHGASMITSRSGERTGPVAPSYQPASADSLWPAFRDGSDSDRSRPSVEPSQLSGVARAPTSHPVGIAVARDDIAPACAPSAPGRGASAPNRWAGADRVAQPTGSATTYPTPDQVAQPIQQTSAQGMTSAPTQSWGQL